MLLFFWLIPLMLGLVVLVRALNGTSVITDFESLLIFGRAKHVRFSVWMGIEFAILAVVFFMIGLFEGAVLLNFGMVWIALASLLTASGAILLLVLWLRSGRSESQRAHQHALHEPHCGETHGASRPFRAFHDRATSKREKHSDDMAPTHDWPEV
jgi:hypothetical protein